MKTIMVQHTENKFSDVYKVDNKTIYSLAYYIEHGVLTVKMFDCCTSLSYPDVVKQVCYAPNIWKRVITE